ncbi:MAG: response regulator [Rhodocyclaceae bacterium]|nr:response regulator [Rhodocyclaceae bacterium]MBX3670198.1 response regulator [Rhodocyclaceae bacterium]
MTHKPTILAIDDTPVNLRTLGAALSGLYDLQIATSGPQGLALAMESPPDLILLDVMMPDMDGYEVCRRLRAEPRLRHVPVIFITALAESEAEAVGLELGAADYLAKPINVAIAQLRIRNVLERETLRREVERHRDQLEELVKERTLALSVAKEAAEAGNRVKLTLLRNISHELRTPLHVILGMVGLARRRTEDARVAKQLTTAESSAQALLALVDKLLDIARMESGQFSLARTAFTLAEVVDPLLERTRRLSREKGLDFSYIGPAQSAMRADVVMLGDPLRLRLVLSELLGNAVKFSEQGEIRLSVACSLIDRDTLRLRVEVADDGVGIAEDERHRVFESFHQADGSTTRKRGGTGIGLFLCRELIGMMGGRIGLESRPGKSSTFWFEVCLPMGADHAHALADAHDDVQARLREHHSGAPVLVVDADEQTRAAIRGALEQSGPVVFEAANVVDALGMLQAAAFRLILLDVGSCEADGLDLVYAIRSLPQAARQPLLALTSGSFGEHRDDYLRAGINGYIPKPVTPALLRQVLLDWLSSAHPAHE